MNQKKTLKLFSGIFAIILILMIGGWWAVTNFSVLFNIKESSKFVEDTKEYLFTDIIPTLYYADAWQGGADPLEADKKYTEEQKEAIIACLNNTKYKGISKSEKKEWLGKKYPKNEAGVKELLAFYPSEKSNQIIYGPDMLHLYDIGHEVPGTAYKNITGFYIIQEEKSGRMFLALYYKDTTIKNEEKQICYTYYLIEDSTALANLDMKP